MKEDTFFQLVALDYQAHLQGKTSWSKKIMTLLFSRGFHTTLSYRLQRVCLRIPLIGKVFAKILWYLNCIFSNCDISYLASLEGGIFLPHPTGIVIGDFVKIARGTTILQNVTIGIKDAESNKYPVVGKYVYLGAGSVLVGAITIGHYAKIGANSVVLKSVMDNATAVGVPAYELEEKRVLKAG